MLKTIITSILTSVVVVVLAAVLTPAKLGYGIETIHTTFGNGITVLKELSITGTSTHTGAVVQTGNTTQTGNFALTGTAVVDEFTQGGGVLNISTTSATYTLTEAELLYSNVIEIEAIASGQAALALTLPATSTWATLLPSAGDTRSWIIEDNHTAAATTTTVTAGTGIDLIAYTANDDLIDGGEFSMLSCWRKETTDIGCLTSELVAAD